MFTISFDKNCSLFHALLQLVQIPMQGGFVAFISCKRSSDYFCDFQATVKKKPVVKRYWLSSATIWPPGHVHGFNALQGGFGWSKVFESGHRPDGPFDRSAALQNRMVQVPDLVSRFVERFHLDCCGIGDTFHPVSSDWPSSFNIEKNVFDKSDENDT